MDQDARLVAISETNGGTRRIRPESVTPKDARTRAQGPSVNPDDLLRDRGLELASESKWRVRLDRTELFWDFQGGYTSHSSNAKKWESQWDAYNHMLKEHVSYHTWDIEAAPRVGATATAGFAGGARYGELVQAWTGELTRPGDQPTLDDGPVHALAVGRSVPNWAVCGTYVKVATQSPWPPRSRRCERCNSIASALPKR